MSRCTVSASVFDSRQWRSSRSKCFQIELRRQPGTTLAGRYVSQCDGRLRRQRPFRGDRANEQHVVFADSRRDVHRFFAERLLRFDHTSRRALSQCFHANGGNQIVRTGCGDHHVIAELLDQRSFESTRFGGTTMSTILTEHSRVSGLGNTLRMCWQPQRTYPRSGPRKPVSSPSS